MIAPHLPAARRGRMIDVSPITHREFDMIALPAGYPTDLIAAFDVLKTRKRLGMDELKVLALVEAAGESFYLSMAKAAKTDQAKKLLTRTSQEERGHAHRILKALQILNGGEAMILPDNRDNPLAKDIPNEIPLSSDFLSMLEQAEFDGDTHYQSWAEGEPNAEIAKLLRQNGAEETRHGERAQEVKRLENFA
jgi:rubrerythrin